jgi:DNA-binding NarL/FixJ family response regulator
MSSAHTGPIRVLCVDDHPLIRLGISSLIGAEPDMVVVESCASGEQAIEAFRQHRPDITLMDLQLPGMSGLDTIRHLHREAPEGKIIVLTMHQGDEDIFRALEAGAKTYLLKDMLSDDLVRFVREVHSGGQPVMPVVKKILSDRDTLPVLTVREIEIVKLIARGMRNKEIGAKLEISEETVKVHVKKILRKLHVNDRSAVVTIAVKRGILHVR